MRGGRLGRAELLPARPPPTSLRISLAQGEGAGRLEGRGAESPTAARETAPVTGLTAGQPRDSIGFAARQEGRGACSRPPEVTSEAIRGRRAARGRVGRHARAASTTCSTNHACAGQERGRFAPVPGRRGRVGLWRAGILFLAHTRTPAQLHRAGAAGTASRHHESVQPRSARTTTQKAGYAHVHTTAHAAGTRVDERQLIPRHTSHSSLTPPASPSCRGSATSCESSLWCEGHALPPVAKAPRALVSAALGAALRTLPDAASTCRAL